MTTQVCRTSLPRQFDFVWYIWTTDTPQKCLRFPQAEDEMAHINQGTLVQKTVSSWQLADWTHCPTPWRHRASGFSEMPQTSCCLLDDKLAGSWGIYTGDKCLWSLHDCFLRLSWKSSAGEDGAATLVAELSFLLSLNQRVSCVTSIWLAETPLMQDWERRERFESPFVFSRVKWVERHLAQMKIQIFIIFDSTDSDVTDLVLCLNYLALK